MQEVVSGLAAMGWPGLLVAALLVVCLAAIGKGYTLELKVGNRRK